MTKDIASEFLLLCRQQIMKALTIIMRKDSITLFKHVRNFDLKLRHPIFDSGALPLMPTDLAHQIEF